MPERLRENRASKRAVSSTGTKAARSYSMASFAAYHSAGAALR